MQVGWLELTSLFSTNTCTNIALFLVVPKRGSWNAVGLLWYRRGRDGQKKKIGKVNEKRKRGKVKRSKKWENEWTRGGRGPRAHVGQLAHTHTFRSQRVKQKPSVGGSMRVWLNWCMVILYDVQPRNWLGLFSQPSGQQWTMYINYHITSHRTSVL